MSYQWNKGLIFNGENYLNQDWLKYYNGTWDAAEKSDDIFIIEIAKNKIVTKKFQIKISTRYLSYGNVSVPLDFTTTASMEIPDKINSPQTIQTYAPSYTPKNDNEQDFSAILTWIDENHLQFSKVYVKSPAYPITYKKSLSIIFGGVNRLLYATYIRTIRHFRTEVSI